MLSEELVDIATRHQVYLERLKAGQIQETSVLFDKLDADLMKLLDKLKDQNIGVLAYTQIAKLIEDVQKGQQSAYTEHLVKLAQALRNLSEFEHEFEVESLNEVLLDDLEVDDDGVAALLWPRIQERAMTTGGTLLSIWLGGWVTNEVTRAGNMVRRAHAEGWTVSQLKSAFRGTKAGAYQDGLWASARRNTATTINTAVQHVATVSRETVMENVTVKPKGLQDGIKVDSEGKVSSISAKARLAAARAGIKVGDKIKLMGYRWISILDSKTSQICRSLDGQVFAFRKGPLPPAHPNCRSSIIAEIQGRFLKRDALGRFQKMDERQAVGASGKEAVDGKVKFYEWLKKQPEAFQNDALGVTRATLFRKGGMSAATFAKLNLDKNFQPLTLAEMRRLKPNAFRRAGL